MSDLKSQLKDAQKQAMRAKEKQRLIVIRSMLAEIKRVEVDERIELDDARILAILDKMLKQRRDSISQFEAANRNDLADQEKYELTVVVVEHILKVVMNTCEQITVLDHGQKIAEGSPEEVQNDHAVIEAYLGREMADEDIRQVIRA
jgi:uncharacterized protein YqeY